MSNTLLTPDMITKEFLRVLHQSFTFIGRINRQYDDQFASSPKIGSSLRIRKPMQYTVRSGRVMQVQDSEQQAVTLTVATQRGVDISFTSEERAMKIDDFSDRHLKPAAQVLAANVEALVIQSVVKDVYNIVDHDGTAVSLLSFLRGKQSLDNNLAPMDGRRTALLSTEHEVKMVDALKGLFQDSTNIASQYREGKMGRTAGFDFYASTHMSDHTTGTAVEGDTLYNVAASQTGATITVSTGTTSFLAGDVITLAGCNRVHPETKADTGVLQQFVVTANSGTSATSLAISPSIVITGPYQNVTGSPTTSGAVVKVGAGASELLNSSLVFHEDFCTFATADLPLPGGVDFAKRMVQDGISLRVIQDYDIINDLFPCRFDILFGWLTQRPEHGCRVHADG